MTMSPCMICLGVTDDPTLKPQFDSFKGDVVGTLCRVLGIQKVIQLEEEAKVMVNYLCQNCLKLLEYLKNIFFQLDNLQESVESFKGQIKDEILNSHQLVNGNTIKNENEGTSVMDSSNHLRKLIVLAMEIQKQSSTKDPVMTVNQNEGMLDVEEVIGSATINSVDSKDGQVQEHQEEEEVIGPNPIMTIDSKDDDITDTEVDEGDFPTRQLVESVTPVEVSVPTDCVIEECDSRELFITILDLKGHLSVHHKVEQALEDIEDRARKELCMDCNTFVRPFKHESNACSKYQKKLEKARRKSQAPPLPFDPYKCVLPSKCGVHGCRNDTLYYSHGTLLKHVREGHQRRSSAAGSKGHVSVRQNTRLTPASLLPSRTFEKLSPQVSLSRICPSSLTMCTSKFDPLNFFHYSLPSTCRVSGCNCSDLFRITATLSRHLRWDHGKEKLEQMDRIQYPTDCLIPDCTYRFMYANRGPLVKHLGKFHGATEMSSCVIADQSQKVRCSDCNGLVRPDQHEPEDCKEGKLRTSSYYRRFFTQNNKDQTKACSLNHFEFRSDSEGSFLTHASTVHVPAETQFQCPQCSEAFKFQAQLARHVHLLHQMEIEFKCPICEGSFLKEEGLDSHWAMVHLDEIQMEVWVWEFMDQISRAK